MTDTVVSHHSSGFIPHLHAFRGFAIVNIVAAHAFGSQLYVAGGAGSVSYINAISESLFHDSTIYFTLISGLLFAMVLRDRGWTRFFSRKFYNVFTPYVLITTLLTLYAIFRGGQGSEVTEIINRVIVNILTGGAMYHLWYIPVLLCLYVMTPFIVFAKEREFMQRGLWLVILLPLYVSREWSWPDFSWQTVVYFSGAYAAGIVIGYRYEEACAYFWRMKNIIFGVAVVSTMLLIMLYLTRNGRGGDFSFRETVFYIQKLSLSVVVILLFRRFENRIPVWLGRLATYSFSIYFLHAVVMAEMGSLVRAAFKLPHSVAAIVGSGLIYLVLSLALSILVTYGVKSLTGKWSRRLIGA